MALVFRDDDAGYLAWIEANPDGYVINTRRQIDANYLVLHRATCRTIRNYPRMDTRPGGFTERGYQKICDETVVELQRYVQLLLSTRHVALTHCSLCL